MYGNKYYAMPHNHHPIPQEHHHQAACYHVLQPAVPLVEPHGQMADNVEVEIAYSCLEIK